MTGKEREIERDFTIGLRRIKLLLEPMYKLKGG
jgi:hypothetical protein